MKRSKRILLLLAALLLLFSGIIAFSPYGRHAGYPYKMMKYKVEINAPPDSAYRFLGHSYNASRWSIFVHHISPLNADSVPDGSVGSRRRCFCHADEKGRQWDELITEAVPGRKRQLVLYNFVDFPANAEHLATEQIYEPLSADKCLLTFTVFFKDGQQSWIQDLNMYFAAYRIQKIFDKNMHNVKRLLETGK